MRYIKSIMVSCGVLGAIGGCGAYDESGDLSGAELAEVEQEIRFGTLQDPFGATGGTDAAKASVNLGGCSATVYDNEWILTAEHCGTAVGNTVTSRRSGGNVTRTVASVVDHPTIDASLARLSSPILDIPRIRLHEGTTASLVNQDLSVFGFGAVDVGNVCTTSSNCVGGEVCNTNWGRCMLIDSNRPLRTAVLRATSATSGTLQLSANSTNQVVLPGDSGGGSFQGSQLVGIHRTASNDLSGAQDTPATTIRDWAYGVMNRPATVWSSAFTDATSWNLPQSYLTMAFPDVNNDGRADVCGRGTGGISCATSTGAAFGTASVWQASFNDAGGWSDSAYYRSIKYPDINNDGRADVCGRGAGGIWCATSTGTAFTGMALRQTTFSDAGGWKEAKYSSTIQYPDLNGDKRADVCGRGAGGVWCATSNGSTFGSATVWSTGFNDASGWNLEPHYSTLSFPDLNGDTRADICGRATNGMWCALSTGTGFGAATLWASSMSDANGWGDESNYRTLQFADVNADGRQDLCARRDDGFMCAKSTGTTFSSQAVWNANFSDASGWNVVQYYRTITVRDINRDGRADVCGRGRDGVLCASSTGSSFANYRLVSNTFSDAGNWNKVEYYSTLRVADIDNDGISEICARGSNGVHCAN